jgi:hypothetical protein
MPASNVVYHTCRRTEEDAGLPFDCECKTKVSLADARARVAEGSAKWKLQRNMNGNLVDSKAAIVAERSDYELWRWRNRRSGKRGPLVNQLVRD